MAPGMIIRGMMALLVAMASPAWCCCDRPAKAAATREAAGCQACTAAHDSPTAPSRSPCRSADQGACPAKTLGVAPSPESSATHLADSLPLVSVLFVPPALLDSAAPLSARLLDRGGLIGESPGTLLAQHCQLTV